MSSASEPSRLAVSIAAAGGEGEHLIEAVGRVDEAGAVIEAVVGLAVNVSLPPASKKIAAVVTAAGVDGRLTEADQVLQEDRLLTTL